MAASICATIGPVTLTAISTGTRVFSHARFRMADSSRRLSKANPKVSIGAPVAAGLTVTRAVSFFWS